jgi:methylglyoxal synthase
MRKGPYLYYTIGKQKHIALIAHDNKKDDLVEWVSQNESILKGHFLCGTGTTARLIAEKTGLPVVAYHSGPLGGDQQIGSSFRLNN